MGVAISLVLATVERTEALGAFLESVEQQSFRSVEVIVIDQNSDDRVGCLLKERDWSLNIVHTKSERGLSRARNHGLKLVRGSIVAFPDDDCVYPATLLDRVARRFEEPPSIDILCGCVRSTLDAAHVWRFDRKRGPISPSNVWRRSASASMFISMKLVNGLGGFDESLGLGAGSPWAAGEETDYLLRGLGRGGVAEYDPAIVVLHPPPIERWDARSAQRGYSYGCGIGKVLRRHWHGDPRVLIHFVRPLVGLGLALLRGNRGKTRYYWAVARGRIRGFLGGNPHGDDGRSGGRN